MFKKLSTKLWALMVTLMMVLSVTVTGFAATGDVPEHTKTLTPNGDGTYKLSLTIKGETETAVNDINVIVIFDRSGSMDNRTAGYGSPTRMDAAQAAVRGMANELLGLNSTANPDAVQMALVSFSNTASIDQQPTTSASAFNAKVNALDPDGGTNWEGAFQQANNINFNDDDQTFVIFVSDGNPTFRFTEGNYPNHNNDFNQQYYNQYRVWGSGRDNDGTAATTIARCYEHAVDDARALAQKYGTDRFYTIGAYGSVDRMESLTTAAGAPSSHYYPASDTDALEAALAEIVEDIKEAGIGNASIKDPTTTNVTSTTGISKLLTVDTTSFKYYKGTQTWNDAPPATLNSNGEVEWDLSSVGLLDNGVTYRVEFDVWPSQETYDLIAELDNGKKQYSDLDSGITDYLVQSGSGYSLKTNKNFPTISYDDTRDEAGQQTAQYTNPDPVPTSDEELSVEKIWDNKIDDKDKFPVTLQLKRDDTIIEEIDLPKEGASGEDAWKDSIHIATGLMRVNKTDGTVQILETGHEYTFVEDRDVVYEEDSYYWDFYTETVRPMLINGVLTKLVLLKDDEIPSGMGNKEYYEEDLQAYYKIDGKVYKAEKAEGASLLAENHRRSHIDITKEISEGADKAPEDALFEYTVKVDQTTGEDVWFSVVDTNDNYNIIKDLDTDATAEIKDGEKTGYFYVKSGTTFKFKMKAGWSARIRNIPDESSFSIEETNMPANFTFDKIDPSPTGSYYTINGKKVTGKVDTSNKQVKFAYTNKYEGTEATVKKVWQDADNQDGIRPDTLEVTLSNGDKVTLSENNNWEATITDLPKYDSDGKEIAYTWKEGTLPEGYEFVSSEKNGTITTITNKHVPEETEATVKKEWDDANNQDGIRPDTLKVVLKGNDQTVETVTLDKDTGWTKTVEGLPKYSDGEEIKYTWTEDTEGLPEGYSLKGDPVTQGTITTITNTYTPGKVSKQVKKVWDDNNNIEGFRPDSIKVQLYSQVGDEGKAPVGDPVTLNEENEWYHNWDNLDEKRNGKVITYTVEETGVPEEYTTSYKEDGTLTTITNKRDVEYTKATVIKVWDDNNNQDGFRPETLNVQLKADGKNYGDPVTLDENNKWTTTVEKLQKYVNGKEVVYTWEEGTLPPEYEFVSAEKDSTGIITTITNKHVPETVNIKVKKVWEDNDNQDGLRPGELSVTLSNTGKEYTLKAANNWEITVEGLPKYADGEPIVYKWVEGDLPDGYEFVSSTTDETGLITTITNKHVPEEIEVSVIKVWDDNNNQDGIRPETLNVQLQADGKNYGDPVTLDEDNKWTATVDKLPKFRDEGKAIEYTWEEESLPDGYEFVSSKTDETGLITTITNKHIPATVTVTVSKQWSDAQDQDGYRPSSISVALKADGKNYGDPVTLDNNNKWTYSWTDLDKYAEGKEIAYTVQEGDIPSEYKVTVTKTTDTETAVAYTVNNSHETDKTSMSVEKIWKDDDDKAKLRPTSVDVQLSDADGNKYDKDGKLVEGAAEDYVSVTLSADNNWKYTWETLEKKRAGKDIEYYVDEVGVPKGYIKTKNGAAITNTHENTTYSVKKTWNDDQNRDGIRPSSISVQLYANGKAEGDPVTLNASNDWSYTWDILPKNDDDGNKITYTADETAVPEDYNKEVTHEATQSLIINTHNPAKDEVVVEKVWNDEEDLAGLRPSSIKVQLKRNGKNYGDPVTLNEANKWTHKWSDLLVNSDGQKITYTVDEVSVPKGYIKTVTNKGNFYVITNTHENTSFQVNKVWDDADDQDGRRPSSIKVALKRNGTTIDTVTLNEDNEWQHRWAVLPKKDDDGNEYSYSADETAVPDGYEKTVKATDTSAVITNKHDPSQTTVDVLKQWVDDDDRDRIRPESVSVVLLADGKQVGDAVELNADNNWANTWTDLDEYSKGKKIDYTVKEEKVPEGYSVKVVKTGEGFAYTVVNTHETKKRDISVEKKWDDAGNQDGLRPDSVTVQLYANGDKFGKEVELNEKNDWKHTWKDLNYYDAGEEIEYDVKEVEVPDKYTESYSGDMNTGFKIVNKHEPAKTKVSGTKTWDDNNDKLKKRPDSIIVNLYADGKYKTSITVKPDKDGNWKYTFDDLDKFKKEGKKIKYTVTEDKVEGYKKPIIKGYDITNPIKPDKPDIPVTGDPTTWLSLFILLAAGAVLIPVSRRRKNNQ